MKTIIYTTFLNVLCFSFIFAQVPETVKFNSFKHKKVYQVNIGDFQTVELVQFQNKKVSGTIINRVWESDKSGQKGQLISQTIDITDAISSAIFSQLESNHFEDLKDCSEVIHCPMLTRGLSTSFNFIDFEKKHEATFWDLKSNEYYKETGVIIPSEVIKARRLYSIINEHYNFDDVYKKFLSALAPGRYSFNGNLFRKK